MVYIARRMELENHNSTEHGNTKFNENYILFVPKRLRSRLWRNKDIKEFYSIVQENKIFCNSRNEKFRHDTTSI